MNQINYEITTTESNKDLVLPGFGTGPGFDLIQREAKVLASSDLVPSNFRNNVANCIIGLEIASRLNASPLAILQNLYIVHGKPSWSSQFIIAAINATGRYSPLRFRVEGEGDKKSCVAYAIEKATGETLEGPAVTIAMAKAEGWMNKNGSKWQTMPDLMLRYRSATFFGRLYAPEVLMGMHTEDEVMDIRDVTPADQKPAASAAFTEALKTGQTIEVPTGPDRAAIKAELNELGVEFADKARTETLVDLLASVKKDQVRHAEQNEQAEAVVEATSDIIDEARAKKMMDEVNIPGPLQAAWLKGQVGLVSESGMTPSQVEKFVAAIEAKRGA